MPYMTWAKEWNTGISVIDRQHRRIVDLINDLQQAQGGEGDRHMVKQVLDELVDYTVTHFVFEEELQAEAGYPFISAHKRMHEMFIEKMIGYQGRFAQGEDVIEELSDMLERWLENHINIDDADYAPMVKQKLFPENEPPAWLAIVPD